MPALVLFDLVRDRWPRSDQRHLAAQNVPQLRQLVEAGLAEDPADGGDAGVVDDLEYSPLFRRLGDLSIPLNEPADEFVMNGVIRGCRHRPEFHDVEPLHVLPHPVLPEEDRARRRELDRRGDHREQW